MQYCQALEKDCKIACENVSIEMVLEHPERTVPQNVRVVDQNWAEESWIVVLVFPCSELRDHSMRMNEHAGEAEQKVKD